MSEWRPRAAGGWAAQVLPSHQSKGLWFNTHDHTRGTEPPASVQTGPPCGSGPHVDQAPMWTRLLCSRVDQTRTCPHRVLLTPGDSDSLTSESFHLFFTHQHLAHSRSHPHCFPSLDQGL